VSASAPFGKRLSDGAFFLSRFQQGRVPSSAIPQSSVFRTGITPMWTELAKMSFAQFEDFIRLHGGRCWRFKESIGDSVVTMMEGQTKFVAYRCDNIRLWCRGRT
jgi:hypothetical protein